MAVGSFLHTRPPRCPDSPKYSPPLFFVLPDTIVLRPFSLLAVLQVFPDYSVGS